ncbi:uroporphyrinogen-III synthase [Thalassolituus oleivorans]|uniref:uroporphyrinogen-III synthase n=1 Tax=Thalassolituus oleivorans TaxID=187493 RepID=UPI0023EFA51D|nr:uroporphyrinogen-III synthase [Thalassolituus oleivorans]
MATRLSSLAKFDRRVVVVTRPRDQADELITAIAAMGIEVRHQPLIDIVPFADDSSGASQRLRSQFLDIDHYDAVIAISQNAAECGLDWLDRYWPQCPVGIAWYAVGPTTADALRNSGMTVSMPETRFDSEGLLAVAGLQENAIRGRKILIWRGVGGRETLAEVLRARGAVVEYAELYERTQVPYSQAQWHEVLEEKPLLLLSSGQALDIAEQQVTDLAQQVAGILVPSERVAERANSAGYACVLVAASARNEDTLASLRAWYSADE